MSTKINQPKGFSGLLSGVAGLLAASVLLFGSGCGVKDEVLILPIDDMAETVEESTIPTAEDELTGLDNAKETTVMESAEEETVSVISVYVCGAVAEACVVELPEGSRAEEALALAGGLREDAARDYVNLAMRLSDEQMLYFPTASEAEKMGGVMPESSAQTSVPETGLVNINTAGIQELCTLPGIGESRARDIVAYRDAHGAFAATEEIMEVSGIKDNVYSKISDRITVGR